MNFDAAAKILYGDITKQLPSQSYFIEGVYISHVKGIRHTCVKCGNCCFQEVPLLPKEMINLEYEKGILNSKDDILKGTASNKKCIHLTTEKTCDIYKKRPGACRFYPWTVTFADIVLNNDKEVKNAVLFLYFVEKNQEIGCQGYELGEWKEEELIQKVRMFKKGMKENSDYVRRRFKK